MTSAIAQIFLTSFRDTQRAVHENAVNKGFWKANCDVGTKIALIHSELSEGFEAWRNGLNDDKLKSRPGLEVEMADAIIRMMDLAQKLDMDLAGAIVEKHSYNKTRTYLHGKKF
jgi:NTP pyrophosphatase (non-canonical NTP hydrolase)